MLCLAFVLWSTLLFQSFLFLSLSLVTLHCLGLFLWPLFALPIIGKETIVHLGNYSFHPRYADQMWCFSFADYFSLFPPVPATPHVVCAAGWLLSLYQEVVLFIPYVGLLFPWSQKGTISAAACGSGNTEPGRFHRTHLWTAMFHGALLWISEDSVFKMTKIQF